MAYQNNGYTRKKILTVTKGDYTQTYDICSGFTDPTTETVYSSLSTSGFAQLTDRDYAARRTAFINYVYSEEDGLETDCPDLTVGSTGYNTTLCPLP